MSSMDSAFQGTTVEVLRCVEQIFGADTHRAEEFFYVADRENQSVSYVSSSYKQVWGRTMENLRSDPLHWMRDIHPEDQRRVRDAFKKRSNVGSMDIEYRIVRPDRQVRYIHDRSFLVPGGDDGNPFIVGRCQDVTSVRDTQNELRERHALFTEVADHIGDIFWVRIGRSGILDYVSPAFEQIWGRSREDLLLDPRSWYNALHPDDRDHVENLFAVAPHNRVYSRTYRIIRPRGDIRWIRERAFPMLDESGQVKRLVGIAQDITDAQLAEESRLNLALAREAQRSAESQVRARDDALAIVSHDLRNPLCAIDAVARRLTKPMPDEKRLACIAALRDAVGRMNRLLDDLLDVSRMEAGQFAVSSAAVPPQVLVDQTLAAFADWPGSDEISLRGSVASDLPATIDVDRFRMIQVLTNLVGNSIKFTPKGGEITIQIESAAGRALFTVADTGAGIAPLHQEHLFDRFWQVDRTDRRGAGLGLSIAKGIVEAHGGTIWVESTLHQGTRMMFSVPLVSPNVE